MIDLLLRLGGQEEDDRSRSFWSTRGIDVVLKPLYSFQLLAKRSYRVSVWDSQVNNGSRSFKIILMTYALTDQARLYARKFSMLQQAFD